MSRSISYSRYFRMPTPIDTGSAATPNQARPITPSSTFGPPEVLKIPARNRQMIVTAAPLASHFSCWRRSPLAAPPAQRLAGDEGQRQPEHHEDEQALDDVEPAGRVVDRGQATVVVDADRVRGEGAGDRHGGRDEQHRENTP